MNCTGWPPNTPYDSAEARRTQVADATFRDNAMICIYIYIYIHQCVCVCACVCTCARAYSYASESAYVNFPIKYGLPSSLKIHQNSSSPASAHGRDAYNGTSGHFFQCECVAHSPVQSCWAKRCSLLFSPLSALAASLVKKFHALP